MENRAQKLGIIGAGRYGQLIKALAIETKRFTHITFFDDFLVGKNPEVLAATTDIEDHYRQGKINCLLVGIGYRHFEFRRAIFDQYVKKIPFTTCIHPSAAVSPFAKIGQGSILFSMSCVDTNAVIGANVAIFNQSAVAHDAKVGDHSFVAVGVALGGGSNIGQSCFLGMHSTVIPDVNVGDDCIICAGTLVSRDLEPNKCVIGNPSREVEKGIFRN